MEKTLFFDQYRRVFELNSMNKYVTDAIMDKMYRMVEQMLAVNAHTNLTAITDWNEIIVKHLADCCLVLPHIPENAKVLDVGCGGGFPCLPIAIARPDLTVVGLDSTGKKVDYVNESAALLELPNLSAICGRAEELANTDMRESFDIVVARAVASLPVLCELCIPFAREGGTFCAMKGAKADEEMIVSQNACRKLGAPIDDENIFHHRLFSAESKSEERTIFLLKKEAKTPPKYPRPFAQIKKKPL